MNTISSGFGAQMSSVLAPELLVIRIMFSSKRVPVPDNGLRSVEKPDMRNVRIRPVPGSTFPSTLQLFAVNPAGRTGGSEKLMTDASKVRSPWNPTNLSVALTKLVITGVTKAGRDVSTETLGSNTAAIGARAASFPGASGASCKTPSGRFADGETTSP